MKRWKRKLKSSSGETLVELLASILIGSLSVILLTAGIAVSVNINKTADEVDENFYKELSAAEKQEEQGKVTEDEDVPDSVIVTEGEKQIRKVSVNFYGGEHLRSYKAKEPYQKTDPSGGGG